ncbi:MAG: PKD domain-containing protein [Bacteroidota bacterium]|nr:PKD domain-containing protein [Bacteroidota bacterium]
MIKRLLIFFILLSPLLQKAQCPQVFDYLGTLSTSPYWISCSGTVSPYTLNFQSNTSWGSYTLSWGDGSPNQTGASYVANAIIPHTYAAAVDTHVVTLIIPSLNCTLTGVVVQEKPVNASIQIPLGGVTQVCAPHAISFINSSTDVSQTTHFQWDFGDGSPLVNFNYTNAGATVTHTYNKGTVNCQTQVTLKAWNYCSQGNTTIATYNPIQVYDIDNAAITPDKFIRCWPDNVFTFTNTTARNCVPQANTFQRQEWWNFGNYWGLGHDSIFNWHPWPPTLPITIAYPAVGSYTVQLRDSNLCGVDTTIITVSIVNPPVAGVIAPLGPLCQNVPLTFTNSSAPGYVYLWNWGTGGGFVNLGNGPKTNTFASPGTYTVQVAAYIPGAGSACTSTAQVVVTILPSPTANFINNPSIGCNVLNNVVFNESSIGAVAWNWNFGNLNTSTLQAPPNQNYPSPGAYTVSLTVTSINSCVNTKTTVINVYPNPIANFSPTATCVGSITNFTNTSTVTGTNAITSYTWDFGDASATSNSINPTHIYSAAGSYTVGLIASTAFCKDSIKQVLVANIKPTANFAFTPTVGCPPFSPSFTNTSLNGTSYLWNFGISSTSTSTATNPSFTYTNSTGSTLNYSVNLIALSGAGCSDTIEVPISVYPLPIASFTANLAGGCSPLPVTFTNSSIGGSNYTWDFGDANGSIALNPSHTYTNVSFSLQSNTITLVVTNSVGCTDSIKKTIQIFPQVFANFTMLPPQGCTPLNISFPSVPGVVSYTWSYGDGSPIVTTSATPTTHVFTNTTVSTQTYTVKLIARNAFGCVDSSFGYPIVFPKPVPDFSATPNIGCSPMVVSFTNSSSGNNSSSWLFNNGQASIFTNPTITFTNAAGSPAMTFSVKLVVGTANNCYDSIIKPVTLFPRPMAVFSLDTPACSPKVITFTNTSQGATSYLWHFGDIPTTTTVTAPTHQYVNSGFTNQQYTVSLVATNSNNCKDTLKVPLVVHPKANFFISALPDSGCTPLKVFFPPIVGVQNYQWNFGDGNTATTGSISNIFVNPTPSDKSFTVQLIAQDIYGCADTPTYKIKVFPNPIAVFQVNPLTVFVPNQSAQCINLSSGAVSYFWKFGDGGTSTDFSPEHIYTIAGEYQITLIATSIHGCRDTFDLPEKLIALEETFVQVPNAFTPNINGSNGSLYGKTDLSNDVFHPQIRGTSKYLFSIYSRWGELLFETKNPDEGWDGYYKNKLCTQDVYVWKISATFIDGKSFNKTGDVLLMR